MGFINVAERTLTAKLVYYGVGVGGKTTSLQQVHGIFCPRNEVQLVSINTEEDSTLLFDFLPINLGQVGGFKIKIQGFTVPGQPKYRQMRKYVLQGADAVVFVVDSQRSRLQENLDSLQSMRQHLRTNGTPEDIPIVVQYNKRDLPDILSERELDEKFKFREGIPAFPSVATEGQGVFEAFVEAATLLIEKKVARYGTGREGEDPHAVAEGVREKLWNICDAVRRDRAAVAIDKLPQTRLALPDGADGADGATHSGTLAEHAPPAPRMSLAPLAEDEVELSYELRDSTGASEEAVERKKVFSEEELNHEIAAGAVQFHAPASEEVDDSLFDKTMLSNLELARRYGELDEQRLLLDRKVHELVEVAQQTVHDLNRPLSAIRLMLSTLAKGYLGQLSEPVNQAVDNGLQAVHQMERLLRDLLDSSRLDSDGIKLTFADCDLTLLLAEVLRTLRYEIEETGVRVLVEPMPCIVADSWALTKVFMNLLGNAIQYGPNDKQAVIQVSCQEGDDEWVVEVRDNGIGIPDKDKPRLFRRFERGSNTGGISGTGLGLHIVKEIVQGHGGSVRFDSAVGSGTTFFLHLPKAPKLAPHSVVSETAARADL